MHFFIPPFLFATCILLQYALSKWIPLWSFSDWLDPQIGYWFFALGVGMIAITGLQMVSVRTEIHTFKMPRQLLTSGMFNISRNPIYLGFSIALLGAALRLGTITALLPMALFIFIANSWYIPFEERNLEQVFGEDFRRYSRKVRRWL